MVLFLLHLGGKLIGNYSLGQLLSDLTAKCKGQILCIFQNPILRRSLFPSFSTLSKIYGFSHCFMIITAQDAHCTGPKGIESPKSQHFWNLMWNISQDNGYWYWSQSVCFAWYILSLQWRLCCVQRVETTVCELDVCVTSPCTGLTWERLRIRCLLYPFQCVHWRLWGSTYRVFFLTGPPDFKYQKEKQVAANQD